MTTVYGVSIFVWDYQKTKRVYDMAK